MLRALTWIVTGAALGAGATAWWQLQGGGDPTPTGDEARPLDLDRRPAAVSAAGPVALQERLTIYRDAAASDSASLEATLRRAARESPSPARDLEIDAALVRLTELDPAAAADAALLLRLDERFLSMVFEVWAASDRDGALAAAAAIGNARLRRAAALGLLSLLPLEEVAAALPPSDRAELIERALVARAEYDPVGAFAAAERISDEAARAAALGAVTTVWAHQDPAGAMLQAGRLPDPLRARLRQQIAAEWGRFDVAGLLAFVETVPDPEAFAGQVQSLIGADPERLLRIGERIPGQQGRSLRMSALFLLAGTDPVGAILHVDTMPPGADRTMMLQQVASSYGRADPAAALAWVQSLAAPPTEVQMAVLTSVAAADPALALAFIERDAVGFDRDRALSIVASRIGSEHPELSAQLADRLAMRDDISSNNALGSLLGQWVRADAESALGWALSKGDALDSDVINRVAQQFAALEPVAAAAWVDRLPAERRGDWLVSVAAPYSSYDPAGALRWIEQHQGQPGFDQAFALVVQRSAERDPEAAAAMISRASAEVARGSAGNVAALWAQQTPMAAAQWASSLGDQRARATAVAGAVSGWATTDGPAAERWLLSTLPAGDDRDVALTALTVRRAAAGEFRRDMLEPFSSAAARETAVGRLLLPVAQHDPDEARALANDYITDARTREAVEGLIEMAQSGNRIMLPAF